MNRSNILIYLLAFYVFLQFIWWGYQIIDLGALVDNSNEENSRRILMIIGEGGVFILILMAGFWKIQHGIAKEIRLSQRQNNFMLSVTHELKTPLTSIQLALQTLQKRKLSESNQEVLISKALSENQRLAALIDNILNASRIESNGFIPKLDDFAIESFLEKKKEEINRSLGSPVVSLICNVSRIKADSFMIETIFNNLLENALKYSGGDPKLQISVNKNDKIIKAIVSDQGPGISSEEREQIFTKFYRIGNEDTRAQKGSGLGLFITSEFVHLHRGKIFCESNTPKGTKFIIELPNEK
ncbi:MAG: ATP-binding protein [Crocinitomicaceae bacterium]